MANKFVIGLTCKLMRGEAGKEPSTEMTNVQDVTLNIERGEADVTTRGSTWDMFAGTTNSASIEFGMIYDPNDDDMKAILNAVLAGTTLSLFVTDGNGNGFKSDCQFFSASLGQPLKEASTVTITAKPTRATLLPQFVWASATE